ncbi:unnamed protein product, partial [Meganyctiphanes norvegica]
DYCKTMNRVTQFKNNRPGRDYMTKFFKRYKTKLSKRIAKPLKISRARSEDLIIIKNFFEILRNSFKMANNDVNNLDHAKKNFNVDETGFKASPVTKNVLVPVGRPANVIEASDGKTNYSVLVCGNAARLFFPPFVVYKGVGYAKTKSRWMDEKSFSAWVPLFNKKIEEKCIQKPVIIVMDGASSHVGLSVIENARKNNIILVKSPPNSTHFYRHLMLQCLVHAMKTGQESLKIGIVSPVFLMLPKASSLHYWINFFRT